MHDLALNMRYIFELKYKAFLWSCQGQSDIVFSLLRLLLADDHVNNGSYFPFMSIKKVVPYFCVLSESYYVIIWLIVRICVFIKDWKLIYSELFIFKRQGNLRHLRCRRFPCLALLRRRFPWLALLPVLDSIYPSQKKTPKT
jgi:hypothetical protein